MKSVNLRLPSERLQAVLMSGEYAAFAEEVKMLGIKVVPSIESICLPFNERYHADMQMHNCGNELYLLKNDCSIFEKYIFSVNPSAYVIKEKKLRKSYPESASLNGVPIGDFFICNKRSVNEEMLNWYINNGYTVIDVNQGYAACSTVVVDYNAIITDDESVCNGCAERGIDVMKISKGSIKLSGYDYGFIGGSCFKADKNSLCFFGNAKSHKDYNDIKAFCKNYSVDIISLGICELTDIGGVVPIF